MKFRQALFWDVDPTTIDPKKHSRYIIERILDFGNDKEVRWVANSYSKEQIKDVISHSRELHKPSRLLWSLVFT